MTKGAYGADICWPSWHETLGHGRLVLLSRQSAISNRFIGAQATNTLSMTGTSLPEQNARLASRLELLTTGRRVLPEVGTS